MEFDCESFENCQPKIWELYLFVFGTLKITISQKISPFAKVHHEKKKLGQIINDWSLSILWSHGSIVYIYIQINYQILPPKIFSSSSHL